MLIIYCNQKSSRLEYILNIIFEDILGMEYIITDDKNVFLNSKDFKINYSNKSLADEAVIYNSGLLENNGLNQKYIESIVPDSWEDTIMFFNKPGDYLIPFDIFSASFYLISRYEEYLCRSNDNHGRFPAENSLAYKFDFLDKPVIDIWAYKLLERLMNKYPGLSSDDNKKRSFNYIPTLDIDNAWAFKNKNIFRTLGSLIKTNNSVFAKSFRIRVLRGLDKDPYDNFEYIRKLHINNNSRLKYFFLLGNYGKFDKNVSHNNRKYRSLIQEISTYADIGIHPSYNSNNKKVFLKKEINRFENITGQKPIISRQHFLKFTLPETYVKLEANGIIEDYSMGYSSHIGFRAGTCTPFLFYNLEEEKISKLKIFPFQVMDVSLREFLVFNPEEAINNISALIDSVKKVNGTFISLWHNESLSESENWKGWRRVYEHLVKTASPYM